MLIKRHVDIYFFFFFFVIYWIKSIVIIIILNNFGRENWMENKIFRIFIEIRVVIIEMFKQMDIVELVGRKNDL